MADLSPRAEAIKLSRLWQMARGMDFPVKADELAIEWSRQAARDEPIGEMRKQALNGFEGGLFWLPTKQEWVVLYNPHENVPGRANFTIAHEFGHYVLHRQRRTEFNCTQDDALGMGNDIEREADEFASYLLMPINDFKHQVGSTTVTLDLMGHCADRYSVSLTAATLKWLSFTEQTAILVAAREGLVLWSRASDSARSIAWKFRFGAEIPTASLAVQPAQAVSREVFRLGLEQEAGVWAPGLTAREMTIISDRYDMTLSLVIFQASRNVFHADEPDDDMTTRPPTF